MLTMQLRELEQDGLVSRNVLAEKPLQVEYELTEAAYGLLPAFKEILSWSRLYGDARLAASHEAGLQRCVKQPDRCLNKRVDPLDATRKTSGT